MSDPFVGEIRPFGFNFPPQGWAVCAGQLLPLQQNTALFSILGINYGGNGTTTFGLPDLRGFVPIGVGQGPGLTPRVNGESGGSPWVTLLSSEMPQHNHPLNARGAASQGPNAPGTVLGNGSWVQGQKFGTVQQYHTGAPNTQMAPIALQPVGGGQPHNNMMPYLVLNYCIALQGIYPQRP